MSTETQKVDVLSSAQSRDLRHLAKNPNAYMGTSLNKTMCALQRLGLVAIEWFDSPTGYYGRDSRWVITDAGRARVGGAA